MNHFKLRRADFYPDDWIAGTLRLTLEERGAYITICALIYSHGGPIPDDDRWLSGMCRVSLRYWRKVRKALIDAGKIVIRDGHIHQTRCEFEIEKARDVSQKRSKSGAKGGAKVGSKPKRNSDETETTPNEINQLDDANAPLRARVPSTLLPYSDTNVSERGSRESTIPDLKAAVFNHGKSILRERYGYDKDKAGKLLGSLRKDFQDGDLIEALGDLQRNPDIQEPVSWLKARLKPKRAPGSSYRPGAI